MQKRLKRKSYCKSTAIDTERAREREREMAQIRREKVLLSRFISHCGQLSSLFCFKFFRCIKLLMNAIGLFTHISLPITTFILKLFYFNDKPRTRTSNFNFYYDWKHIFHSFHLFVYF